MNTTPGPETQALATLRRGFEREPSPTVDVRRDRLERLERALVDNADALVRTIDDDFGGRSRQETMLADVVATLDGIRHARRHLSRWARPRPVRAHPGFWPSRATVVPRPRGVVGILSPWNYPVNLALAPLAAALAAGNRALLKPSELTPRTSALLGRALRDVFSAEEVAVIEGGPDMARAVTELPLDHLFFTGSTRVGREVGATAARKLVPVTLELGGKSPALVLDGAPVASAAARVAVGKCFNGGQTCIAPDYALVPRASVEVFVEAFRDAVLRAGGCATAIVSEAHLSRLHAMVREAEADGATLVRCGPDGPGRRMAPVLVRGAPLDGRLLTEEIFGPVLPVLAYDHLDEALQLVARNPRPLAAYVFHPDRRRTDEVLSRLSCGGISINDTLVHFANENLPFGGVGASGQGAYHGVTGFDTFSQLQSRLDASSLSAARALLSPPYGRVVEAFTRLSVR